MIIRVNLTKHVPDNYRHDKIHLQGVLNKDLNDRSLLVPSREQDRTS